MEVLTSVGSPISENVEERKKQRMKEKTAKEAFLKFALHILFAVILFSISYVNRDQRSFLIKTHIEKHLYTSSKYHLGFSKVSCKYNCQYKVYKVMSQRDRVYKVVGQRDRVYKVVAQRDRVYKIMGQRDRVYKVMAQRDRVYKVMAQNPLTCIRQNPKQRNITFIVVLHLKDHF